jgi:hypothetical protein
MAKMEQMIEEARKLPVEDRRRLRAALGTVDSKGDPNTSHRNHSEERAGINVHRDEYLGQWVALEGNRLS